MMRARWLVIGALLAACDAGGPVRAPDVGGAAPEFASATLEGDSVSLEELRGKVVLLNVWATWCGPCREEIPALQAIYQANRSAGLEVVGVSIDGSGEGAKVRDYMREMGVTYTIWHDRENAVSPTFRLIGVPSTFLIDREGKLVWKHVGPVTEGDSTLSAAIGQALAGS